MELPNIPESGQPMTAEWGARVVKCLRALRVRGDERTTRVQESESGFIVSAATQPAPAPPKADGDTKEDAGGDPSYVGTNYLPEWSNAKVSISGSSAEIEFSGQFMTESIYHIWEPTRPIKSFNDWANGVPGKIMVDYLYESTSWNRNISLTCSCVNEKPLLSYFLNDGGIKYENPFLSGFQTPSIGWKKIISGSLSFESIITGDFDPFESAEGTATIGYKAEWYGVEGINLVIGGKKIRETTKSFRAKMETLPITIECDVSSGKPILKGSGGGRVKFNNRNQKHPQHPLLGPIV